jgi:hypothetical protein
MKFVIHLNDRHFLTCDLCEGEDFVHVPEKKLCEDEEYQPFLFYGCPNCAGAGFWLHSSSIDEARQVGIAIARCRSAAAKAKSILAAVYQQNH